MSESGHVIGGAFLEGNVFHATVWIDGQTPIDLGTLGGETSECRGINANDWIVGRSEVVGQNGLDTAAFLWRDGEMMNLGNLGGDFAEAYGVNDLNQIVGWSAIDNSEYRPKHAFLWQDGQMTDLGTLDGNYSEAIAINNSGLIVGQASSYEYTTWRPVIWENDEIIDLGTFHPDNQGRGICLDVNEAGDVVGYTARDWFAYRAFLYHDGHMYPLPEKPRWTNSYAYSINNQRQIVGHGRTREFGTQNIGCIWEWGKPVEYLVKLIPPKSNWFIGSALHNNDAGQITGTGYRLDDPERSIGYLITPVHPTMELSAVVPGVAGADNTLSVSGATPGAEVRFVYSRRGGGTVIPGCSVQLNCLQVDSPKVIGTVVADGDGNASITRFVSRGVRGQTILLQAFVEGECAVSQLVVEVFE